MPTIFNMVVDAVVRHWESLLVAEREEQEVGDSSGDEGDRAQTTERTIRNKTTVDNGRRINTNG